MTATAGTPTGSRWHLVALEPRREAYGRDNLVQSGFEIYLPAVEEVVRHARRTLHAARPLFPGYGFAHFDAVATPDWGRIFRTRGVIGVVRIAGGLAALTREQYGSLRALEDADGLIRPKRALAARFRAGDQVRVTDGMWSGLVGEVLTMKGPERVRLLLGALKTEIAADRVAFAEA
jgi:transcription antitermination factor NusG